MTRQSNRAGHMHESRPISTTQEPTEHVCGVDWSGQCGEQRDLTRMNNAIDINLGY